MSSDLPAVPGERDEARDPIAAIQARLRKYPHARTDSTAERVVVYPTTPTGFEVDFQIHMGRYRVHCLGWHEEFPSSEEALNCFGFALSSACRLKLSSRGGMAYRWQLQYRRDSQWVGDSEVGLWFFPFWRSLEVTYLQNNLLEAT